MSVSERQLVALLRLLEDESAEVQRALSAQLRLLDPFHEGRPLTRAECAALVRRFGFRFEDRLLAAAPNRAILERMFTNLIHVYRRCNRPAEIQKARQLTRFLEIVHFRL
ncbi:MAG: transglutaminase family protein [Nitrospinota bacterium]